MTITPIEDLEKEVDDIEAYSEPKISPLQIVRRLKQMSTTAIWEKT